MLSTFVLLATICNAADDSKDDGDDDDGKGGILPLNFDNEVDIGYMQPIIIGALIFLHLKE